MSQFEAFVERSGLGQVKYNQWELTYVDSFPRGEYWETPSDWGQILPNLFGRCPTFERVTLAVEARGADVTLEIPPRRGRVHLAARLGHWSADPRETLLFQTTVRGPIGGAIQDLHADLDLGHEVAVSVFLESVAAPIQERWGLKA